LLEQSVELQEVIIGGLGGEVLDFLGSSVELLVISRLTTVIQVNVLLLTAEGIFNKDKEEEKGKNVIKSWF
jgi:hypothetical protein